MPRPQLTHEMELMGKLRAGHARPLLFVQRKTFRNPAVLYWPQRKGENAMLPILIVDDEPHIARLIEMTLEPLGQPLVLACDGEQPPTCWKSSSLIWCCWTSCCRAWTALH